MLNENTVACNVLRCYKSPVTFYAINLSSWNLWILQDFYLSSGNNYLRIFGKKIFF